MTDIEPFLERLGLLQYYEVFTEEGFDTWETLLDVQETDLEALGVKRGHRRKLQRAIAEHRGQSSGRPLRSSPQDSSNPDPFKLEGGPHQILSSKEQPSSTIAEPKRKYRRHPRPDEHAPEKPPSAYVIFSNRLREEVKHENLSFTETARLAGERWQKLDPTQKEQFENYAASLKETYNTRLAEYKKTDAYKEYAQYLADFKAKHGTITDKIEAKRPKFEGEYSSGRLSTSTGDNTEISSHSPLHTRGASLESFSSLSHGMQGTGAPASLQILTSLPAVGTSERRRVSPNYQFTLERPGPGSMSGQSSMSEETLAVRMEQGGPLSHAMVLSRSPPPMGTPPPPTATRRTDRSDLGYSTSSPAWSRQGTESYVGSTRLSESPTKTMLPHHSFTTSPGEITRDRLPELGRASHSVLPSPHQSQRQQQTPSKGSLPISHLVGPNVSPEQNIPSSHRILPLPFSTSGSQTQPSSTVFGQPSAASTVSSLQQQQRDRGPLPQRYASAMRKPSDDETATGASESRPSDRHRNPRFK